MKLRVIQCSPGLSSRLECDKASAPVSSPPVAVPCSVRSLYGSVQSAAFDSFPTPRSSYSVRHFYDDDVRKFGT